MVPFDEGRAAPGRTGPHPIVVYLLTVTGLDAAKRLASIGRSQATRARWRKQVQPLLQALP
jgi:hypothetical protein